MAAGRIIAKGKSATSALILGMSSALFLLFISVSMGHAEDLVGEWSGTVYQTGPENATSTYPAKMVLKGASGNMDYETLQCGGQLIFVIKTGGLYYFRESITYGKEKCIDGGMVTVEPGGNSVQWSWIVRGVSVRGQLTGG
jgi:hypothetical protein